MKYCRSCKMKLSDQEPFCPLCGPGTVIEEIPGTWDRAAWPENPTTYRPKDNNLVSHDKHIFIFLSAAFAVIISGLLLGDYLHSDPLTWGIDATVISLFIWAIIVLPYAFKDLKGDKYILLFSLSSSSLMVYFDLKDGLGTWSFIVSAVLISLSIINCIVFSIKGS